MNGTTTRRLAPALVALALLAGCSGESTDEGSTPAQGTTNAELCSGYSDLKKAVEDLKATPLDTTGTPEEIQAAAAALQPKVATIKADLNRLSAVSDGPAAAAIGEMNQKADALRESLTLAVADTKEAVGPKITEAQESLNAAYTDLTTKLDAVCPSS